VRQVVVLTTSRADFGHLYWPLVEMRAHPGLAPRLVVTGAHLSPEFGTTIAEIRAAGIPVEATTECLLSSDTDVGMAKTIGVAVLGLADILDRLRPDLLLLIADRYEMLAPAAVALALRIPIAHVEGGEISEGAIDDAVRNALTKMSHIHLTPTEDARRRVLAMGEEAWRVHRVGAPSLDHLRRSPLLDHAELTRALDFEVDARTAVVSYHPVTLDADTTRESDALFEALEALASVVFCFPNADAGSRRLVRRARTFCSRHPRAGLHVNLAPRVYWSLLSQAGVLVGNSSSGIMETASLGLPTVNVGRRQAGRTRPANVIDADADAAAIRAAVETALSERFRTAVRDISNPYGDGDSSRRIAEILAAAPERDRLLRKRALPLEGSGFRHA
jgi:UDP-N-acetylglucosamine 2-epimerase (non-hydrolysing)/GDP/UDP-N,N'-diacetylbacillosamine 2-epimerase (hydrolysing)